MSVIDIRLIDSGFVKTGLCSTLWVNADDSFRAGFFVLHQNLCLVIKVDPDTYFVSNMQPERVGLGFRTGVSLYKLAIECLSSFIWKSGRLQKSTLLHRLQLRWVLFKNHSSLLPNYYYLWNSYIKLPCD
jgi:hypothetical protein